jgi:hypothetical protein
VVQLIASSWLSSEQQDRLDSVHALAYLSLTFTCLQVKIDAAVAHNLLYNHHASMQSMPVTKERSR